MSRVAQGQKVLTNSAELCAATLSTLDAIASDPNRRGENDTNTVICLTKLIGRCVGDPSCLETFKAHDAITRYLPVRQKRARCEGTGWALYPTMPRSNLRGGAL